MKEEEEDLLYKERKENIEFHEKNTEEEIALLDKIYDSLIKKRIWTSQCEFNHINSYNEKTTSYSYRGE